VQALHEVLTTAEKYRILAPLAGLSLNSSTTSLSALLTEETREIASPDELLCLYFDELVSNRQYNLPKKDFKELFQITEQVIFNNMLITFTQA
jgi:hypothetical protein